MCEGQKYTADTQKILKKNTTGGYFPDLLGRLQFSNTKQIQEITPCPWYLYVGDDKLKNT